MRDNAYTLMTRRKSLIVIGVVVTILVVTGAIVYLSSFEQPQIESVKISSIDSISRSSLNLTLSVTINNPNRFDITIKDIQYSLKLSQTGQTLMTGTYGEIIIPAHGSTEILMKSTVYSAPILNLALTTLFTKSAMMEISGSGTAAGLFSNNNFSFVRTFDAYPYISDSIGNLM